MKIVIQFQIFHFVLFHTYFSTEIFFPFISRAFSFPSQHSNNGCLKVTVLQFQHLAIDWLFPWELVSQILVVLCMISNLGFYLGHFHYVVRLSTLKTLWRVFCLKRWLSSFRVRQGILSCLLWTMVSILVPFLELFVSIPNIYHFTVSLELGWWFILYISPQSLCYVSLALLHVYEAQQSDQDLC